jgi:hypothetical protein
MRMGVPSFVMTHVHDENYARGGPWFAMLFDAEKGMDLCSFAACVSERGRAWSQKILTKARAYYSVL